MASVILTMAGPDRPGLVGLVSGHVAEHGGSWLESRLAHLAGQFAGIARIEIDAAAVPALTRALQASCDGALTIALHAAPGSEDAAPPVLLTLDLLCQDRPGILREVTAVLAAAGVNIEELTTDILSGSFSAEHMFHAEARLRLPPSVSTAALRAELETLGEELMVELTLTEPATGQKTAA